ncbi:hypothetical protein [Streptomyces sp. MH60]|nr:hypothetical protein [Streptomyces sp. MH60]
MPRQDGAQVGRPEGGGGDCGSNSGGFDQLGFGAPRYASFGTPRYAK